LYLQRPRGNQQTLPADKFYPAGKLYPPGKKVLPGEAGKDLLEYGNFTRRTSFDRCLPSRQLGRVAASVSVWTRFKALDVNELQRNLNQVYPPRQAAIMPLFQILR
jgi:hypothetical protein